MLRNYFLGPGTGSVFNPAICGYTTGTGSVLRVSSPPATGTGSVFIASSVTPISDAAMLRETETRTPSFVDSSSIRASFEIALLSKFQTT